MRSNQCVPARFNQSHCDTNPANQIEKIGIKMQSTGTVRYEKIDFLGEGQVGTRENIF